MCVRWKRVCVLHVFGNIGRAPSSTTSQSNNKNGLQSLTEATRFMVHVSTYIRVHHFFFPSVFCCSGCMRFSTLIGSLNSGALWSASAASLIIVIIVIIACVRPILDVIKRGRLRLLCATTALCAGRVTGREAASQPVEAAERGDTGIHASARAILTERE